ncbi:hypothetical protein [Halorhabdus salina]|uniref:hypothetical protein n=1 Tax=Halorhabdus salina TaxID=2750670 RepID=UPI0015EE8863|nr:hypothetical protein [Halorhabdus salina]
MSRNDSTDESGSQSIAVDDVLDEERLAPLRSFSWGRGILTGALSFVVGYLLMAALFFVGPPSIDAQSLSGRFDQIAYIFYNSQFVDGLISAPADVTIPGGRRFNFVLEATEPAVPIVVYLSIPVVSVLVIGGLFQAVVRSDVDEYVDAGLTGAAMALGYVAVALVGTFLIARSTGNGIATFAPDRIQTVVLCVAYPFVLGTLGALGGLMIDRE